MPVDTSPPSCTSANSCHQWGLNQHTSTLTARGRIALCSSWLQGGTGKKSIYYSPHFHFFYSSFYQCSVLMLCFPAPENKLCVCVCVFTVGPLQQPHLLVDIVAVLQPALSSSRWWSWRVISPTQRLLRRETWEVCACQSQPCRDDSVRHLKQDHYHAGTLCLALLPVLILCCLYRTAAGFIVSNNAAPLVSCRALGYRVALVFVPSRACNVTHIVLEIWSKLLLYWGGTWSVQCAWRLIFLHQRMQFACLI